jgi:hypothetical protein
VRVPRIFLDNISKFWAWAYLLQDLVNVDLVGLDGLCLLLAGTLGGLLHNFLGSRCLGGGCLDGFLSDFGSHGIVCVFVRVRAGDFKVFL